MGVNWKGFKSGSDVRGLGLADENDPLYLSDPVVGGIAAAFAGWLSRKTGRPCGALTVSVGHDPRVSSERIKSAVVVALTGRGVRVLDCGLSSTPAMFMTTVDLGCDGAVQITASHHPMDRNGLKFFTASGGLGGGEIAALLSAAEAGAFPPTGNGRAEPVDYMKRYAARLRDLIRDGVPSDGGRPLEGFKIAVDAGNGAGGFYARDVLAPLGADVSGSVFLEPDGTFPNHIPNPENEAAMRFAAEATVRSGSDLGVVFDTDVDRAGCVDNDGTEINRNRLVAIAAHIALEEHPGAVIVTDSVTSDGLAKYIASAGGVHLRFKRGYKNVIDKQLELTAAGVDCPLAIETSGHAAFAENYFLDDGAYLVTRIIILMAGLKKAGKSLSDVVGTLETPAEETEARIKILSDDFQTVGERFIAGWTSYAAAKGGFTPASDNYEGIRLSAGAENGDGWILVRLSVHDPVLVVNAESDTPGGTSKMLAALYGFAAGFGELDLSALTEQAGQSG